MLFQYTHLPADSIRLVRFLPYSSPGNIFLESKHQANYWSASVRYAALSYVCGDLQDRKPITLSGRAFMIPVNLWTALNAVFEHHAELGTWFWIDAVCINQRDTSEKTQQVRQMGRIFACAQRVLAWLGEEDWRIEEVFGVLEEAHGRKHRSGLDWILESNGTMKGLAAMQYLLGKQYFSRAWTIPEFTSAKEVFFVCGRCRTMATPFIDFLASNGNHDTALLEYEQQQIMWRYTSRPSVSHEARRLRNLDDLLGMYVDAASFDVRDRIFAALNDPRLDLPEHWKTACDYRLSADELGPQLMLCYDGSHRSSDVHERAVRTFVGRLGRALGLHDILELCQLVKKFVENEQRNGRRLDITQGPSISLVLRSDDLTTAGAEEPKI